MFAQEPTSVSNPTWLTILLTVSALVAGPLGKWIYDMITGFRKDRREDKAQDINLKLAEDESRSKVRIAENEQAIALLKELLATVRSDVDKMSKHLEATEAQHIKCKEDNIIISARLAITERELEGLKKRVTS